YAEVVRKDPSRLSSEVERSRRAQLLPGCAFSTLFAFAGPFIVGVLYDPRYAEAGLMLQIQGACAMVGLLSGSYSGVLWALARPGLSTALLAAQVVIAFASMLVGAQVAGGLGVVVGSAVSAWPFHRVNVLVFRRLGLWHRRTDAVVIAVPAVVATIVIMTADWGMAAGW